MTQMTTSERFKGYLKRFEMTVREEPGNLDAIRSGNTNLLILEGKKCTALEEVELLDTLATYLTLKSEDDIKSRLFFELFPVDREMSTDNICFLVKLATLASCVGISPVLELIAVWLKIRLCHWYAISSISPITPTQQSMYNTIHSFVKNFTVDMLSISGSATLFHNRCESSRTEESVGEHPFLTFPSLYPLFVDAIVSGLTLVYGFKVNSDVTNSGSISKSFCTSVPPVQVISCLILWLRIVRNSKPHQPTYWSSVDWPNVIRRFKFLNQPRFSPDQFLSSHPPTPLCILRWTVFEPLWSFHNNNPEDLVQDSNEKLSTLIADLHYEFLQCLGDPVASSSTTHRHNPSSFNSSAFSSWVITCSRKLERTKEFMCLEALINEIHEQCNQIVSNYEASNSMDKERQECVNMTIIRLAEYLQLNWTNGRIRNLSADEFQKLLAPLSTYYWIELIRSRFKR